MIGGAIIIGIGWFIARLVSNPLSAVGLDKLSDRMGILESLGEMKLSRLVGFVGYTFILIPIVIAGLNALQLDAVTQPAIAMLTKMMDALPLVFSAFLVLGISYVVAGFISCLTASILAGVGFNNIPGMLGMARKPTESSVHPRPAWAGWCWQ